MPFLSSTNLGAETDMQALSISGDEADHQSSLTQLPFPPLKRSHIMHCSYDYWHPKYRSHTLKSRIINLNDEFISYLREDGIVLPSDTATFSIPSTSDTTVRDDGWDDDTSSSEDPSSKFPEILQQMRDVINEFDGMVVPKLNWSAPKDATWISMNSMACTTPSEICLLLKTSDFITHDLEHAFDGCQGADTLEANSIPFVLVLRKWFKVNPSCEFRCFVRNRRIIGICQRDLNHFEFLPPLVPTLSNSIHDFFERTLKHSFPDEHYAFDVYLPEPHDRVRLVDINPWAERTDPLLFSWLELLTLPVPMPGFGAAHTAETEELPASSSEEETDDIVVEEVAWLPEFRLVKKDDPEAYSFASPQYSAHKLPRDVVDASIGGETSMREFADQWKRMLAGEGEMQAWDEDDSGSDKSVE